MINKELLFTLASNYSGLVHGDDAEGNWDIEFPRMVNAVLFMTRLGLEAVPFWSADIRRGDSVTSMHTSVTLTVRPN